MFELPCAESASRVAQLEGPEEVAGLLEVWSDSEDLVNQVFHADNAVLAQLLLNESVLGKRDALLVDLAITTLVDEFTNRLKIRIAVGNEGFNDLQHLRGGLSQAHKDAVVDLEKTEELKSLALLGVNLVDTIVNLLLCALRVS
jgi:hypothetical protein